MKIFVIFLFLLYDVELAVNQCNTCIRMSQFVQTLKGKDYATVNQAAKDSLSYYTEEDRQFMTTVLQYNFRKFYWDINDGAGGMSVVSTCADMGYCDLPQEFAPSLPISPQFDLFWQNHSALKNTRDKTIIVLHDTETPTLQETVEVLRDRGLSVTYIVDIDGQVYQYVRDHRRAWHAGSGIWRGDGCDYDDTNTRSVGIETVNHGNQPFPSAQVRGIYHLIDYLRLKWHVDPWNIIAHHENGPDYKYDISGYFSWKGLYDYLGYFKDLWKTKLSKEDQSKVLLSATITNDALKTQVQQYLFDHGYGTVNVGDPYDSTTKGKVTTAMAIQSFNRKFCPEVFILEDMTDQGNQIINPLNQQVYGLTLERLQWFAANQPQRKCVNY
ncbi:unnamed protein product, partial [Mesorhabditis belari]|uniref:N-acetylmuramoyl-L-alanine amidase n=1 Tax=Mesorhabditis belari TaxID=2138241 RepID=A0AAF3EL49_9BILA